MDELSDHAAKFNRFFKLIRDHNLTDTSRMECKRWRNSTQWRKIPEVWIVNQKFTKDIKRTAAYHWSINVVQRLLLRSFNIDQKLELFNPFPHWFWSFPNIWPHESSQANHSVDSQRTSRGRTHHPLDPSGHLAISQSTASAESALDRLWRQQLCSWACTVPC